MQLLNKVYLCGVEFPSDAIEILELLHFATHATLWCCCV